MIYIAKETVELDKPRKIVGYFNDARAANAWFDEGKKLNVDRDVEVARLMSNIRRLV